MVRVAEIFRRGDGTIETAVVVPSGRRGRERYAWAMDFADRIPMRWPSLFHLLLADAGRN